jgi:3-deoxy-manno-octulosonate cytidylyltransferase (CMP-KDO synthetase)
MDLAGTPMVLHVVARARQSAASAVHVATDDKRIEQVCRDAGVSVLMTRADHPSGTDRLAEAVSLLGLGADAVVVNVQGDEPMLPPQVIDQVAANLVARPGFGICTLYAPLADAAEFNNPNVVKLLTDSSGRVLYFSRAQVPWPRDGASAATLALAKRHIGLYAYRVDVLRRFVTWRPSALEETEKLEQLRAMHYGVAIHAEQCCAPVPPGVDTQHDLEHVRLLLGSARP